MSGSPRPVLIVAHAGVLGGAERVLLDWALALALARPVLLACPPGPLADVATAGATATTGSTGSTGASATTGAVTVLPLHERPLRARGRRAGAAADLAALSREVAGLARRHAPAVVVASGARPILALAAAPLGGAARVALHHDLPPDPVTGGALRAALGRYDRIVAVSGAVARAADPRGRRLGRTAVIHPGVDLAHWRPAPPPAGPPRALVLGAIVAFKRPELTLEIAARVPGLQLELAGAPLPGDPPGLEAALRERAARPDLAGRVQLLGHVADPREPLARAHLLLHGGDREPFGLALVEALAAGRPVVAPAAAGPLEIVTPGCGRLYAPGDAGAGAAAVAAVLANPPAPGAVRERAAAFDGGAAAARFAALVERLAQRA